MAKKKDKKADKSAEKATKKKKRSTAEYEAELKKLQGELVKLQYWVKEKGLRVIVVFEGRDAAGKGGVIKRITERVSPRVFRVEALPAPIEREKTQMYAQRYIRRFPAAGVSRYCLVVRFIIMAPFLLCTIIARILQRTKWCSG